MNTDGLFENATPASQQTSPAEERKNIWTIPIFMFEEDGEHDLFVKGCQ